MMAWQDRKTRLLIISLALGLIAGLYGLYQTHQDAILHDQNQDVVLYDMKILLDNQRIITHNIESIRENGTVGKLVELKTHFAYNYSQIPVNPMTGQP